MKFRFWHKMTAIFGFLDEKCIEMEIFIITSWLFRIMTSLKLCQLYRDLYGKMAFWPQWRHQLGAANLWQATVAEEKQLLSCVFFVRLDFSNTFFHFDIENDDSSPLIVGLWVFSAKFHHILAYKMAKNKVQPKSF